MNKFVLLISIALFGLSGCSLQPIGKEDFTCSSLKKGGVCAGPRDIYELTNNRESLENLSQEELDAQKSGVLVSTTVRNDVSSSASNHVYEKRTKDQHSPESYQPAKMIPQTRFENGKRDGFMGWPNNGEPLAPEALAVMTEPKAMRVLVTAWKDKSGSLNLPGYIYVDVQPKTWKYGEDANLRPTRVVPLQMRKESQQTINDRKHKKKGVSPLEIMEE